MHHQPAAVRRLPRAMCPQRRHDLPGQLQDSPRPPRLGVSLGAHRPVDRDGSRVQINFRPPQRPCLFRAHTGQQRQHHIRRARARVAQGQLLPVHRLPKHRRCGPGHGRGAQPSRGGDGHFSPVMAGRRGGWEYGEKRRRRGNRPGLGAARVAILRPASATAGGRPPSEGAGAFHRRCQTGRRRRRAACRCHRWTHAKHTLHRDTVGARHTSRPTASRRGPGIRHSK
jgi:hypothetical protein